jgi:hypothetical protein
MSARSAVGSCARQGVEVRRHDRPTFVDHAGELDELGAARLDHEVDGLDALLGDRRRLLGHRDKPSTFAQHARRAGQRLAADGVEDEIDRPDNVLELGAGSVERLLGSELARPLHARSGRGADHMRAAPARELGREMSDAAGGSVDQHSLAFLQAAVVEQSLPGGQPGERDRRALDIGERARLRRKHLDRHDRVLRRRAVAVEARERVNGVADRETGRIPAESGDRSRQLVGGGRRQTVERPVELVPRDRRRVDADECLTGARIGDLSLLDRERVEAAGSAQTDRGHRRHLGLHMGRLVIQASSRRS